MRKILQFLLGIFLLMPFQGNAQYCTTGLYSSACSSGDYIDKVVFGTINNSNSGCNGNTGNYIYYNTMSTTVSPGMSYTIQLASGTSWSQHFGVWIDFNQDGDFDDAGEFVFNTTGSKPGAGSTVTGTVNIPVTALGGTTRMRVRSTFSSSGFTATQSCASQTWGECEDYNINITSPSADDMGVTEIQAPQTGCGLTNAEDVIIKITNFGSNSQSSFQVSYQINGGTVVNETVSSTIAGSGGNMVYTFVQKADLSTPGTYTIKAWTTLTGDNTPINDTTTITIISLPTLNTFPYVEDFSTPGNWTVEGNNPSWQHGVPGGTGITAQSPGNACWVTGLTSNYNSNEDSWIKSPCFDLSTLTDGVIKLDIWWESENNWDGTVIQYSLDGGSTWQRLGNYNDPINWYNDDFIIADPGGQDQGWTGTSGNNGSGGWVIAQHDLGSLNGAGSVIFRVAFASDGSVQYDGVAVDNIVIAEKPNVSLGPDRFICVGNDSITFTPTGGTFSNFYWSTGATTPSITVYYPGIYWVRVQTPEGVIAFDTVEVFGATIIAHISEDTMRICPDSVAEIIPSVFPLNASVAWSNGQTSPILVTGTPGQYILSVTDTTGCVAKDSVVIEYHPIPNAYIPQDTFEFCEGSYVNVQPVLDNSVTQVWWSNGVTTPSLSFTSPGTYVMYAANSFGCAAKDTVVTIMNNRPQVNLGQDEFICNATTYTLNSGISGNYSYTWSTGANTPVITVNSTGTYWVSVTDNSTGCQATDSVNIVFAQGLDVDLGPDRTSCGSITLTAPSYPGVSYLWSTGENSQSITVNQSGQYVLYLFNPYGCNASDSINITIKEALTAYITSDQLTDTIDLGTTVQFIDATVPVPDTWFWDFGDGTTSSQQSPTHTYNSLGTYLITLIVQRQGYCADTAYKTIVVVEPTSIEYQLLGNSFKIFPVPASDYLSLQGTLKNFVKSFDVEIKNIAGQAVYKQTFSLNNPTFNEKLSLRKLSKGTYILIANFEGNKVYRRIVKY